MAEILGEKVRIKVGGVKVYAELTLSLNYSESSVDLTHKDIANGGWMSKLITKRGLQIQASAYQYTNPPAGELNLTDMMQYSDLKGVDAVKSIEITSTISGMPIGTLTGSITGLKVDFNDGELIKYSFNIEVATPPTWTEVA